MTFNREFLSNKAVKPSVHKIFILKNSEEHSKNRRSQHFFIRHQLRWVQFTDLIQFETTVFLLY